MTLAKLLTFIKSLWWHIYAGFPKSNQQQIDYRFSICSSCDKFDEIKSECLVCGCNINNKKMFLNKLAWADQECPIGKWNSLV